MKIEPRGTKLSLQVNPEELAAVEKLDGCYALRTDLSPTAASKQTIHDRYKDLALVEWAGSAEDGRLFCCGFFDYLLTGFAISVVTECPEVIVRAFQVGARYVIEE